MCDTLTYSLALWFSKNMGFFFMTDAVCILLFVFWLCLFTFSYYKSLSASSSHLSLGINFVFICLRGPVLNQPSSLPAAGCVTRAYDISLVVSQNYPLSIHHWVSWHSFFFWGEVVNLMPDPQPGGPGSYRSSGPYLSASLTFLHPTHHESPSDQGMQTHPPH